MLWEIFCSILLLTLSKFPVHLCLCNCFKANQGKKIVLFPEINRVKGFLSPTLMDSRLCIRIYIFIFKKSIQKKQKKLKKKREYLENLTGYDDIVCGIALCTFNLLDREFLLVVHLNFPIFAGKSLCWSLFLIKNFQPTQVFSCKYCGIFKEQHLFWRTVANGCFYQMLFRLDHFKAIYILHNLFF